MTADLKIARAEPATAKLDLKETEVGSVFVSNYPPYSFWKADFLPQAFEVLNAAPQPNATLGLYLHLPFCRKRCKFCYFRVYTDKNSNEIQAYLDAVAQEVQIYSTMPAIKNRPLKFVYFGGGTPSYISAKHLQQFAKTLQATIPWEGAEEVTFECEPGTLSEPKLEVIRAIGVTRLSLGIENFNDRILQENGRAHLSEEIYRTLPWIRAQQFEQLNIDLIAGMVGETWDTWRETVQKTIDIDPDSVTIYQMELPYNTVYSKTLLEGAAPVPVADWNTKREWQAHAVAQLAAAGYEASSAYTMVKKNKKCRFVYRDAVWQGTDMMGTGVASFGHLSGVHIQNVAGWEEYFKALNAGQLPLQRAFVTTAKERLTREMILQLKTGRIKTGYFQRKFGANILREFAAAYQKLREEGMLTFNQEEVTLTAKGFLRVDLLLSTFYAPHYRNARYT